MDLFAHVEQYNRETGENNPTLPYIVVIVNELADLMIIWQVMRWKMRLFVLRKWLIACRYSMILATPSIG